MLGLKLIHVSKRGHRKRKCYLNVFYLNYFMQFFNFGDVIVYKYAHLATNKNILLQNRLICPDIRKHLDTIAD